MSNENWGGVGGGGGELMNLTDLQTRLHLPVVTTFSLQLILDKQIECMGSIMRHRNFPTFYKL